VRDERRAGLDSGAGARQISEAQLLNRAYTAQIARDILALADAAQAEFDRRMHDTARLIFASDIANEHSHCQ
jgi:hypothetical protein